MLSVAATVFLLPKWKKQKNGGFSSLLWLLLLNSLIEWQAHTVSAIVAKVKSHCHTGMKKKKKPCEQFEHWTLNTTKCVSNTQKSTCIDITET